MGEKAVIHTSNVSGPIPALDTSAPYTSRLSARSALYTDLCLLLDGTGGAVQSEDYRRLVI